MKRPSQSGRRWRRWQALWWFERGLDHTVSWTSVGELLAGGQLKLMRAPGPGKRYRVAAGSLTLEEAARALRAQRALTMPSSFIEYDSRTTRWRTSDNVWRHSKDGWFKLRIGWQSS